MPDSAHISPKLPFAKKKDSDQSKLSEAVIKQPQPVHIEVPKPVQKEFKLSPASKLEVMAKKTKKNEALGLAGLLEDSESVNQTEKIEATKKHTEVKNSPKSAMSAKNEKLESLKRSCSVENKFSPANISQSAAPKSELRSELKSVKSDKL